MLGARLPSLFPRSGGCPRCPRSLRDICCIRSVSLLSALYAMDITLLFVLTFDKACIEHSSICYYPCIHCSSSTIWLDNVCIDQSNSSDGLRVLPVHVMACKWCAAEWSIGYGARSVHELRRFAPPLPSAPWWVLYVELCGLQNLEASVVDGSFGGARW